MFFHTIKTSSRAKGFTLLELIIVIVIIGVLAIAWDTILIATPPIMMRMFQ